MLRVVQVAEETHGGILLRAYPQSPADLRTAPLPDFLASALRQLHAEAGDPDPRTLVFRDRVGRPLRRSDFRRRVWLPSLVQRVIGHEQASTTLNRYTHTPDDYAARVPGCLRQLCCLSAASGQGNALRERVG
ncbi:hypothetical protein [Micromonospora sp. DPT]|uniref:hypothetical protein n=1 Tax=Micromonospora sp. DPT TaxID=3142975 RepID=UPI00320AF09B